MFSGIVRKAATMGAKVLKAGPILIPAIIGAQKGLESKNMYSGLDWFVYEASGYSLGQNVVNTSKVAEVAVRDIVLFGIGSALSYVAKRV